MSLLDRASAVQTAEAADVRVTHAALRTDGTARPPDGRLDREYDAIDGPVPGLARDVRMNEIQVKGTHNSYHVAPALAFHASHRYTHLPLDQQADRGVRTFELDVHARSDGELEVYHIAWIDRTSTCSRFADCLKTLAHWSSRNRNHAPIYVWIEVKDSVGGAPIPDLMPIEKQIASVFPRERLITPAWLQGDHTSPRARIAAEGWPRVDDARGRVMFIVLNRGDERVRAYTHGYTHLDDRLMFVNAVPEQFGMPWAVVTKLEGDLAQPAIAKAHAASLLIATNVCAVDSDDEVCARRNQLAIRSGIHMLKDDLPFRVAGRKYALGLPSGSPSCNPVTAREGCAELALE